jgi:hypothetical protein
MTNEAQVTRFYQGDFRRGKWTLHTRDAVLLASALVGCTVNIGTKDGVVFDSALVTSFNERNGILTVEGGLQQAYSDPQPRPTGTAEVSVHDVARGYIHAPAALLRAVLRHYRFSC